MIPLTEEMHASVILFVLQACILFVIINYISAMEPEKSQKRINCAFII